tara:strand:- start:5080 stop:8133 length:3054 start_codon:yes stop_codon:yes gene_type:complete
MSDSFRFDQDIAPPSPTGTGSVLRDAAAETVSPENRALIEQFKKTQGRVAAAADEAAFRQIEKTDAMLPADYPLTSDPPREKPKGRMVPGAHSYPIYGGSGASNTAQSIGQSLIGQPLSPGDSIGYVPDNYFTGNQIDEITNDPQGALDRGDVTEEVLANILRPQGEVSEESENYQTLKARYLSEEIDAFNGSGPLLDMPVREGQASSYAAEYVQSQFGPKEKRVQKTPSKREMAKMVARADAKAKKDIKAFSYKAPIDPSEMTFSGVAPMQSETSKVASDAANASKEAQKKKTVEILMEENNLTEAEATKLYEDTYGKKIIVKSSGKDRTGSIKDRLEGYEDYSPFDEFQDTVYTRNERRIAENAGQMGVLHDEVIELNRLSEEKIAEKARYQADNLEAEQTLREDKLAVQETQAKATAAYRKDLEDKLNRASKIYDQKLLELHEDEEGMPWYEIFKKSSIAIAALAAAGGTVMGQFALGRKYGGMPNVLMPLAMKAIEADMRSTTGGRDKIGGEINAAADLHNRYMQIFKDKRFADMKVQQDMFAFWDKRLEVYKNRLPIGGKKDQLQELQDALSLKHKQSEISLRQAYMKDLGINATTLSKSIQNTENFKGQFVSRSYNAILALKAHKDFTASKEEKSKRPKLIAEEIKNVKNSSSTLARLPSLKQKMVALINDYDYGMFGTVADLKISDMVGQFTTSQDRAALLNVKNELKVIGRLFGQSVEQRLTNEDAEFWEEVTQTDLGKVNLVDAYVRLMSMEYYLRQDVLSIASRMRPERLSAMKITLDGSLRKDTIQALKDYSFSVQQVVNNPGADAKSVVYNVGMEDIGKQNLRFKNEEWAKIQGTLYQDFINNISSPSHKKQSSQRIQEAVNQGIQDGRGKNNPYAGLVQVPTEGSEPAYLKPVVGAAFNQMSKNAASDGVYIRVSGSRGGFRTNEMTQSLQADGYGAIDHGHHTEEGGGTAVDIKVNASGSSPESRWLRKHGARYGFFPKIYQDKSGKTIYHHYEYDPSRKIGM